jgi:hypothetical protein
MRRVERGRNNMSEIKVLRKYQQEDMVLVEMDPRSYIRIMESTKEFLIMKSQHLYSRFEFKVTEGMMLEVQKKDWDYGRIETFITRLCNQGMMLDNDSDYHELLSEVIDLFNIAERMEDEYDSTNRK